MKKTILKGAVKFSDVLKEELKSPSFRQEYRKQLLEAEVAEQLHDMREKKHMSQRQLASKAGMKQPALARIEGGKVNVTLDTLQRLAGAMNCAVHFELKPLRA